jgi:hypothetical protein
MQVNPAIPLDVEHIVRRALQKAPVSRYNAARDMYNALRHTARTIETGASTTACAAGGACRDRRADDCGADLYQRHRRCG